MSTLEFSLDRFEYVSYRRQYEDAARELLLLLRLLDSNYGDLSQGLSGKVVSAIGQAEVTPHFINRVAAALSTLFSDPAFTITTEGFKEFIFLHRWVASIFSASTFRNADHVIRVLNLRGPGADSVEFNNESDVQKFCLLYTPDSEIPINLDILWDYNKELTASLCFALLSPRLLGSVAAHNKREILLEWMPARIRQLEDINLLPLGVLHDVYMHCSYADLPSRHKIKGAINHLLRRMIEAEGIEDVSFDIAVKDKKSKKDVALKRDKPLLLIVLEWFTAGHSIFRTHSQTMRFAKEQFHVVAMGYENCVDDQGRAVFDEFVLIPAGTNTMESVRQVRDYALKNRPSVLYMPSLGMFPLTMFLANLRIAPMQVFALGHPATSNSPYMDYVSVEDDYVGDPGCFSEQLIRLPKDGQPYVPTIFTVQLPARDYSVPKVVNVAIAATTMKINPSFLDTCRALLEQSRVPVRLHFFVGFAHGIVFMQVKSIIEHAVPGAIVYTHQEYAQYLTRMNECDLFLSPFPFGNTNGIVDAFSVGLPGVCRSGPEVFEHIDEALYRRVGLPEWTITRSNEEYLHAALRMIEIHQERIDLQKYLMESHAVEKLYQGDPRSLGLELKKRIVAE